MNYHSFNKVLYPEGIFENSPPIYRRNLKKICASPVGTVEIQQSLREKPVPLIFHSRVLVLRVKT